MSNIILIYSTFPSVAEAEKIINILLEEDLIACANVFPIKSFYKWNGIVNKDDELVVIFKTIKNNFDKICKQIKSNHSYKIPAIIQIAAEAESDFDFWIKQNVL